MTKTKNKPQGKKAQGEETRLTLLNTGGKLFARHGYDGVSMRTLASESGTNLATVSYHFGGKAGLYEAILLQLIARRDEIFPTEEEVKTRLKETEDTPQGKAEVSDWYVHKLVKGLLADPENSWATLIISRELAHPSIHYPMLEERFFNPTFLSLCVLTEHTLPKGTSREEVIISAHFIIGVVLKLMDGQILINRRLGWKSYANHLDTIIDIATRRIRGMLMLPTE